VSQGTYATCNLGDHVGDDPAAVIENRRRVAVALGLPAPSEWLFLRQVHGARAVSARRAGLAVPEADAAVTATPGLPLAVLAADCAPIALLAAGAVGVVHAGWPGLLAGVVPRAVEALRALTPEPVTAVLGPCIRAARYEFGSRHLARLVDVFGPGVAATTEWGTPALDIPAAVQIACARAGVEHFEDLGTCTAATPSLFSHRRDGVTGRHAVVAVLR
jgi:YfiH family protein